MTHSSKIISVNIPDNVVQEPLDMVCKRKLERFEDTN